MLNKKNKQKVVVAMSGGVDSSISAKLLLEDGYEVVGIHMRLGSDTKKILAEESARKACQKLGIKFYPLNLAQVFKTKVISYFLDSYQKGLTPNPCVSCNQNIKFGELLERTDQLGADFLATGHYIKMSKVKIQKSKITYVLSRAKDKNKDQSYFLYHLTQEKLARILFPLGNYIKKQTRELAKKEKIPHLANESQDICFLDGDHNVFLRKHLKLNRGPIKTLDGKVIGEHQGLPLYTIGQRRGVEIGGTGPFYVNHADYKTNTLYVVKHADDTSLYKDSLIAKQVNWISGVIPSMPLSCQAVIRYRHKPVDCIVQKIKKDEYNVKLKVPQRAIACGQSVVFYKNQEVLGGGVIAKYEL